MWFEQLFHTVPFSCVSRSKNYFTTLPSQFQAPAALATTRSSRTTTNSRQTTCTNSHIIYVIRMSGAQRASPVRPLSCTPTWRHSAHASTSSRRWTSPLLPAPPAAAQGAGTTSPTRSSTPSGSSTDSRTPCTLSDLILSSNESLCWLDDCWIQDDFVCYTILCSLSMQYY